MVPAKLTVPAVLPLLKAVKEPVPDSVRVEQLTEMALELTSVEVIEPLLVKVLLAPSVIESGPEALIVPLFEMGPPVLLRVPPPL